MEAGEHPGHMPWEHSLPKREGRPKPPSLHITVKTEKGGWFEALVEEQNPKQRFPGLWEPENSVVILPKLPPLSPQHSPPGDELVIRVSVVSAHLVPVVGVVVLVLVVLVGLGCSRLQRQLLHHHAVLAVALPLLRHQPLVIHQAPGRVLLPPAREGGGKGRGSKPSLEAAFPPVSQWKVKRCKSHP